MRWCSEQSARWWVVAAATAMLAVSGCSHQASRPPAGSAPPSPPGASARPSGIPSGPSSAPPGGIGTSPAGVTTRVDVPADSTEEEYYQACHAAKEWMDGQPKAGGSLFEPYLGMVQSAAAGTPGSWNTPWPKLTLARQAAVIVAARAAANNECG